MVEFTILIMLKWTLWWHFVHSHSVQTMPRSSSRIFSLPQKEILYPLSNIDLIPSSLQPWQPLVCFLSMDLPILGISCKWNHSINDLLVWLLSLSKMLYRFVHVGACVRTTLLFNTSNISLYVHTTFCLSIPHWMNI